MLQTDSPVGGGDIVKQLIAVLADEWFLMVARHVMPGNAIIVHIIKNCKAGFICSIDIELCIVWLANLFVPSLTPGIEAKTIGNLAGRGHLLACGWPKPAIDVLRLQVTTILTTLEVTEATTGPDVGNISCEVKMTALQSTVTVSCLVRSDDLRVLYMEVSICDRQTPPFLRHLLTPCSGN